MRRAELGVKLALTGDELIVRANCLLRGREQPVEIIVLLGGEVGAYLARDRRDGWAARGCRGQTREDCDPQGDEEDARRYAQRQWQPSRRIPARGCDRCGWAVVHAGCAPPGMGGSVAV